MKKKEISPPVLPYFILKILCLKDWRFSILGDFDEEFLERIESQGSRKAKRWYWQHFFASVPRIMKDMWIWRIVMFKNYLTIALRNIKKQKVFSLIKILGLSIALACCIWIYLFVKDEISYNKFHDNADSIYSVINTDNYYPYTYRNIPIAMGPALKEYFPEIERSVRIARSNPIVSYEDHLYREHCHLTDRNFFELFSFRLLQGDEARVLASEDSIVLTQSTVLKYFQNQDPIGKTLTMTFGRKKKDFLVTGIVEDPPRNSTIGFDMLIRIENLALIRDRDALQSWTWPRSETYIQLKKGQAPTKIEAGFPAFVSFYFKKVIEERKARGNWNKEGETITFWLQSLPDIYLHSQAIAGSPGSHIKKSYILTGIGFLVLIIACINFTNLSIGNASTRTVEIGMRKILGADRKNIIRQFWSESIVILSLAMLLGMVFAALFLPLFNHLASKQIVMTDALSASNLLFFFALAGIIGILAGFYPGLILSKIEAIKIIKGHMKISGRSVLTRALILAQFSASIFLIIATLTMAKQITYINNKDLGFNKEGLMIIETLEREDDAERVFNLFKQKAENLTSVRQISGCAFPIGGPQGEGTLQYNDIKLKFRFSQVNYDYFSTMGMKFLYGGDFPKPVPKDINPVVVNEMFVKSFEIDDPIGKKLDSSTRPAQIIGVVEDYHYRDLHHEKEPVIHFFGSSPFNMLLRISSKNINQTIVNLKEIWQDIQIDKPFIYSFQDQILAERYEEEKRWNAIVLSSAVFVILITCMGLVGITTLITNRRIKEIGIRRVLGASIAKITNSMCRDYVILIAISNLISWPLGFYFMNLWLKDYAYRTHMDIGIFLLAGLLSVVISLGTIGFLIFKAASSNPVDCLRYE